MHSKYSTIWAATHSQVTIDIIRDFGHKDANFLSIDQRTVKVLIRYWGRNISVKPRRLWALSVYVNVRCWLVELVEVVGWWWWCGVTSIVVQLQLQRSEKSYQCSGRVSSYCQIQKSSWWTEDRWHQTQPACHTNLLRGYYIESFIQNSVTSKICIVVNNRNI